MSDDEKYIRERIAEGEHLQQDFKFEITSARKIARTLVAFANTEGGRLLIGVKDNGNITGIRSDEEYYMIDSAATLYCRPEIRFESYQRTSEGKTILEIVVPPSEKKPHYAMNEGNKWMAYLRVGDENILANAILLEVWKRKRSARGTLLKYTENETRLLKHLKFDGPSTYESLRECLGLKSRQLKNMLVNLVSIGVVEMEFSENEVIYRVADSNSEDSEFP